MQILALEEFIDEENVIRVIDLFCFMLHLGDLRFEVRKSHEGRTAYSTEKLNVCQNGTA